MKAKIHHQLSLLRDKPWCVFPLLNIIDWIRYLDYWEDMYDGE